MKTPTVITIESLTVAIDAEYAEVNRRLHQNELSQIHIEQMTAQRVALQKAEDARTKLGSKSDAQVAGSIGRAS